jgi:alpha-tubulin suppressor-like RCC1 family protein
MHGVRRAVAAPIRGLSVVAAAGAIAALTGGAVAGAARIPAAGAGASPAVSSSQADHWGWYFGSKVGHEGDKQLSPTAIKLPDPVVQVGSSNSTEYALLSNGTVWSWGQGSNGQLGNGTTGESFTKAVQVQFPAGVQIAFLATDAMPFNTALAVDTKGRAWGWGDNHGGELCLGNKKSYDVPQELPLTDVTALAGADGHGVYDSQGTVYSCGLNAYGVLGDGSGSPSTVPVRVSGLPSGQVTALYSGWENAGALLSNGTYYDWGYNGQGQLGDGKPGRSSDVPYQVKLPGSSPVTTVAQGGSTPNNGQTVVELEDGALYAWGNDEYSQLGDGKTGEQASPEQVFPPSGVSYAELASGGATSYGITSSGDVYAWGYNMEGEVGDGSTKTATSPVEVDTGASLISSTAGNVTVARGDGF